MTTTLNQLTLKALLLDTITYLKHGEHLAPNWREAKHQLCDMAGQKRTINSNALLTLIGLVYKDNDKEVDFWSTIDKFDAEQYLQMG